MKQLGATEVLPIGLGDDQGAYGYLTALDPWMEQLFAKLAPLAPAQPLTAGSAIAPPLYTISTVPSPKNCGSDVLLHHALEALTPAGYEISTDPLKAVVLSNSRLTTPTWQQNVFHLSMSIQPPADSVLPSHVAGDVLIVYPSNSADLVSKAEAYFSSEFPDPANTIIDIQYSYRKNTRKNRLLGGHCTATNPTRNLRCTVRDLFSRFLGLSSVPQRGFFEELSRYVPVLDDKDETDRSVTEQALFDEIEEEREKLMDLASAEGADLYDSYCYKEQRGFLEILTEFRTLRNGRVPLHRFLEMVPPLLPRHYSIASSGYKTPNLVSMSSVS
jgi:sulfite reductase alpha subunit-like flavoprotein